MLAAAFIYRKKEYVDYRVPYFEVRRSLSLANEIGNEHRTRSTHMMYHTLGMIKTYGIGF